MGIFDISTKQKSFSVEKKEQIIALLTKEFSQVSQKTSSSKNQLNFKNFSPKNVYLNYDLVVNIESSSDTFTLNFEGELQNLWILVILIILGILFTYGFGLIVIVLFVFLQKKVATKYIENSFEKSKKEA